MPKKIYQAVLTAVAVALVGVSLLVVSHAAQGDVIQLYLSPAANSTTTGTSYTVQIRLKVSGQNTIGYIKAELSFPQNLVSVSALSLSGSYCTGTDSTTHLKSSNSTGTIDIVTACDNNAANGDFLIASFKVTSNSAGSANIAFTNQSSAQDSRQQPNLLTGTSGGSYTITAPAPAPSPTPTPTPSPAPTPSPTPTPTPTPKPSPAPSPSSAPTTLVASPSPAPAASSSTTGNSSSTSAPIISGVHTTDITSNSVTLNWQTDASASYTIKYGTSPDQLTNVITLENVQTSVSLSDLPSNKTIYFSITPTSNGVTGDSYSSSFKTTPASSPASKSTGPFIFILLGLLLIGAAIFAFIKRRYLLELVHGLLKPEPYAYPSASINTFSEPPVLTSFNEPLIRPKNPAPLAPPPILPVQSATASPVQTTIGTKSVWWRSSNALPAASAPLSKASKFTDDFPDMFEVGEKRLESEVKQGLVGLAPIQTAMQAKPNINAIPPAASEAVPVSVSAPVKAPTDLSPNRFASRSLWWKTNQSGSPAKKPDDIPDMFDEGQQRLAVEEQQGRLPKLKLTARAQKAMKPYLEALASTTYKNMSATVPQPSFNSKPKTGSATKPDDIPDMFDAGEKRLKTFQKRRLIS